MNGDKPIDAVATDTTHVWHSLKLDEVLRQFGSRVEGLEAKEAAERRIRYGPNRLTPLKAASAFSILIAQFRSLVVLLLLGAAVVALSLGDILEAAAIGAVLVLNTLIGFAVELRARRSMDALLSYQVPTARVVRCGRVEPISSDQLVPGDVIELAEGDTVPADARIISGADLQINEAPLTGESLPVAKSENPVDDLGALLAERTSMVFAGTSVYVGRARALVVCTGNDTQIGRVGTLLATVQSAKTPLESRLDRLGHRLVWLTLAVAALVAVLGILKGAPVGYMIEVGIALAIAAVPEGLPAVATIALAVGLRRMARRHALVRRLAAVEALGATTVVCTDKTGTLTAGKMVVTTVATCNDSVDVTGFGSSPEGSFLRADEGIEPAGEPWLLRLLQAAALTSRASIDPSSGEAVGDPTDAALSILALKGGVDPGRIHTTLPCLHEIPFSSSRRASGSIHERGGESVVFVKGAPETVLEMCCREVFGSEERILDGQARQVLETLNEDLASRGLRVIALAEGRSKPDPDSALHDLTFLGLVGIMDPPADGVANTVQVLRQAHIRTVMITGDQQATGEAMARKLGMVEEGFGTLGGRDLSKLTDSELAERVGTIAVFSRVSPEDKLRIVSALQECGEVVAMIGDGVNDAAALKKADVGVAMGKRGTDVAKKTASIVLMDDRFLTIGAAVEQGRVIFENIRKFVFYLFSCNVAEVFVLLAASVAGLPLPLTALQILWLNLVTDTFPALALAMEPADADIMNRPPRDPDAAILSRRFLLAMGFYSVLITAVTLTSYLYGLRAGDPQRATTLAFMTLALAQLFHLGNARSRTHVLSPPSAIANRWALAAVPLVLALQVTAVHWSPLATVLGTVSLQTGDWLLVLALAAVPAIIGQVVEIVSNTQRQETMVGLWVAS